MDNKKRLAAIAHARAAFDHIETARGMIEHKEFGSRNQRIDEQLASAQGRLTHLVGELVERGTD